MAPVPTLDEIGANPELAKDLSPAVAADLLARLAAVQEIVQGAATSAAMSDPMGQEDR
jgi:hypothetical protein